MSLKKKKSLLKLLHRERKKMQSSKRYIDDYNDVKDPDLLDASLDYCLDNRFRDDIVKQNACILNLRSWINSVINDFAFSSSNRHIGYKVPDLGYQSEPVKIREAHVIIIFQDIYGDNSKVEIIIYPGEQVYYVRNGKLIATVPSDRYKKLDKSQHDLLGRITNGLFKLDLAVQPVEVTIRIELTKTPKIVTFSLQGLIKTVHPIIFRDQTFEWRASQPTVLTRRISKQ